MTVSSNDPTNDLALDLFADWETRQANGDLVSLEEVCAGHPELVCEVRAIAERLAGIPGLGAFAPADRPTVSARALRPDPTPDWVEVGRGPSGVVYRGRDPALGTVAAYKVLHPRAELLPVADTLRLMRRFELEARILARLKHPAIVRIHKTFLHGGRPALEMEYLPGGTLKSRFEEFRGRGTVAVARFMERVARAVGLAHAQGIVHRDLKPSNILLDADDLPCVSDFGVAKLLERARRIAPPSGASESPGSASEPERAQEPATRDEPPPGTWEYLAPEQFDPEDGPISPATDVWALGVILYQLLSGECPFSGASRERVGESVCREPVPPVSGVRLDAVGRRLLRVARRCLEKQPDQRFGTAELLADALRDAGAARRSWVLPVGAVLGVVLALVVAREGCPSRRPAESKPLAPADSGWKTQEAAKHPAH